MSSGAVRLSSDAKPCAFSHARNHHGFALSGVRAVLGCGADGTGGAVDCQSGGARHLARHHVRLQQRLLVSG